MKDHPDRNRLRTRDEAERTVADFFDPYVKETHPCKDSEGKALYPFFIENLKLPEMSKPQSVNLLDILETALQDEEPDFTRLNQICLALLENGQRHEWHGNYPPKERDSCARKGRTSHQEPPVYCRYHFPRNTLDARNYDDRNRRR